MNMPVVNVVSPEEAMTMVEQGEAVLIDVREQHEYDNAHIADAVLIPVSEFDPQRVLDAMDGRKPVFYCKLGPRAERAAAFFSGATGEEAWLMDGSIHGWTAAGLPLVR